MELSNDLVDLVIALALGMLVGLQRQWSNDHIAGIRTFGLVGLMGAVAGQLTAVAGPWIVPATLLAVAALTVTGNLLERGEVGAGQTTEVALLLVYLLGVYIVLGSRGYAVVMGTSVAVILQMKGTLKDVVSKIDAGDLQAILQFAVISLIVLPVLPDRTMGPYDVLNPRQIWWMVVLIVGINLLGYAGHRLLGRKRGTIVAGVLGGLVSSTATTASSARTPSSSPIETRASGAIILLATAVVFVRVLIEIAVVERGFLRTAAPPVLILLALAVAFGLTAVRGTSDGTGGDNERTNPSRLGPALFFAALYGAVLLAVAVATDTFGGAGLYGVAALSGLTDMDAITLSTSELVSTGRVAEAQGWRAIVIASIANLVFKGGIVAAAGNRLLLRRVGLAYGAIALAGVALILLWPT